MTISLQQGRFSAAIARTGAEVAACQSLRQRLFQGRDGADADRFDPLFHHAMLRNRQGDLIGTFRYRVYENGPATKMSYTGQCYDMDGFSTITAPLVELGRFCAIGAASDPDLMRMAWGVLTAVVTQARAGHIFGCSSFPGTDPAPYAAALAQLAARHQGPEALRPRAMGDHVSLRDVPGCGTTPLPPLLRSYVAMGGWVGDHLVIDQNLARMHVFTCLDVAAVPPARARALRALAQATALA